MMKENVMDDLMARRFLLGDVSVEERERIEELAFDDPETFAFMQSVQDDLIDDFVNDELSSEERERFQNYFLTQPGRRQDVRIGRALQMYLARDEQLLANAATNVVVLRPRVSIFDWLRLRPASVSLAVMLLVSVGLLVVILTRRTDDSQRQAQNQSTRALPTPSGSPIDTPIQATPSPTAEIQHTPTPLPQQSLKTMYVVLVPGGPTRSEGEEKVRLVGTAISFELPVVDVTPYQHYQASLQRNGNDIRTWPNLQPRQLRSGRALKIDVPAGLLKPGQRYRFIVMGHTADGKAQPVDSYYFHVSN